MPRIAKTDDEIDGCFDVMSELRPHLKRDQFLALVRRMESEGYRMAYLTEEGQVVAVAGYRISTNFWLGKHLYVDDLATSSQSRSKGHGEAMIGWLRDQAKANGCRSFDLDSGTHRGRAHKFYFKHGFTIASYHFLDQLELGFQIIKMLFGISKNTLENIPGNIVAHRLTIGDRLDIMLAPTFFQR